MIIANRTIENAQKIANLYQAQSIGLKQFSSIIHKADIIISSTAASVPIIGKGLIESALKNASINQYLCLILPYLVILNLK